MSISAAERARRIKIILFDVDGVLTDGTIWLVPAPANQATQQQLAAKQHEVAGHKDTVGFGIQSTTMAEAKGLRNRRIMLMYAARNAILPQVTALAITLGFVVSGQVLIETIFSYPGVGFDLVTAATNQDYPLLQGLLLFIVAAVLLANFMVDILYSWLDPRARVEA